MKRNQQKVGFSLIELLAVIAIIGVIVAIAIPSLSMTYDGAREAQNRSNAKSIASMSAAAHAAGITKEQAGETLEEVVMKITTQPGLCVTTGPFQGHTFSVLLPKDKVEAAKQYLRLDGDQLVYANKQTDP